MEHAGCNDRYTGEHHDQRVRTENGKPGTVFMDQYMQFSGVTMDKLKEQVRPEAVTRIQSSLVLEQIAKEENIEVSPMHDVACRDRKDGKSLRYGS